MSDDGLVQRKNWFRCFPEGSVEFILVTRVLGVAALLALGVLPGVQRSLLSVALGGVLWLDYLLTQWWAIQLSTDLTALATRPAPSSVALRRERWQALLVAMLPATILITALVPWPSEIPLVQLALGTLVRRLAPLWLVLFLVALWPGYRALRRIQFRPSIWTLLLLIPVLHWLATHRLLNHFHARIREASRTPSGQAPADEEHSSAVLAVADVTWVLAVVPWAILTVAVVARGQWPDQAPLSMLPSCGTLLAAVFAVANLAAMEGLQRQFVTLIRRA